MQPIFGVRIPYVSQDRLCRPAASANMCSMPVVCVLLPRFELVVAVGAREALLQGPAARVEMMCEWMREGDDSPALVDSLQVQTIEPPHTLYERFEQVSTA